MFGCSIRTNWTGLPRIVFIHGHGQNAETFRQKTGSIRRNIKKSFDIDYIQAPYTLKECGRAVENSVDDTYSWMLGPRESRQFTDKSFEEIHRSLEGAVGVVAFSLGGAVLYEYLCRNPPPASLKCAAFFSSFIVRPITEPFPSLLPTFHCYGTTDQVILPEESASLAQTCALAEVFNHEGGHLVPSQSRKSFTDFVKKHAAD
eukprot:GEMP01056032.1.p1 GENE.GEMP01056032.1~~GEMP01056032.1.p1  ORF type:complete len:203 (+),score=31.41 GEMP01056032.1:134-742(+)